MQITLGNNSETTDPIRSEFANTRANLNVDAMRHLSTSVGVIKQAELGHILKIVGLLVVVIAASLAVIGTISQSIASFRDADTDFTIQPEYRRHLRRVVISLAGRDSTLELQHDILAAMPNYTKIILLLPKANRELLEAELETKQYGNRVELVTYAASSLRNSHVYMLFPEKRKLVEVAIGTDDTETHSGSVWAQDLFEVMTNESDSTLLVRPFVQKWFSINTNQFGKPDGNVTPDNTFSTNLSKIGLGTSTVPLAFFGGNILIDKLADGQMVAFCGSDMFATTRTIRSSIGLKDTTDEQIANDIKVAVGADQVIILGKGRNQPYLMFHLDQAMLILSDRTVAIPKLTGNMPAEQSLAREIQDVQNFLVDVRSQMTNLGYRIIDIETSIDNLIQCQHYVNAIPYVNETTGQKTVMMPAFSNANTASDKLLVSRNTSRLESLGYDVITVPTGAEQFRGGIHCLVNVLD